MSVTRHPYLLLSHTKYRDNPLKDLTCLGITSISIRTSWSFTPVSARKLLRFERMTSYLPDPTGRFKKAITVKGPKVTVQVSAMKGVDSVYTAQNRTRYERVSSPKFLGVQVQKQLWIKLADGACLVLSCLVCLVSCVTFSLLYVVDVSFVGLPRLIEERLNSPSAARSPPCSFATASVTHTHSSSFARSLARSSARYARFPSPCYAELSLGSSS